MARMSAEARREEVVGIAFRHFAEGGFDGTSTEAIAREAGVSQPYLFRLFKTKRGLYEACVDQCFERVEGVFAGAVAGATPEERFAAMGHAYGEQLLPDRHALLFQMRAYAVADPEIRAYVRGEVRPSAPDARGPRGRRAGGHLELLRRGHAAQRGDDAGVRLEAPGRAVIFRRRRPILLGSLIMVLVAAVFALPVFGELGNDNDFDDPSAEAVVARDAVVAATGTYAAPQLVALVRLDAAADSAAGQERIGQVARAMQHPGVAAVVAYEPGGDERLVSRDRRSTYLLATYKRDERGATDAIEARMRALPYVTLGGGAIAAPQVGDQVSADILRAEIIAFPLLFLLSLLVFRSAVSALLPLAVGATTILLSFLAIRVVNAHVNPMSIYALNLINGLGLGLAIDYSLFMVSRFREELAAGRSREEALAVTMRTAGHVVFFSAITVACALAALIVFRQRFLYSMGVGGALCALIAAGVSLDAAAGAARRAGRARERGRAAALEGRDRARGRRRAERVLVPALAAGDAAAGAVRRRRGRAADRDGAAVPADRVHGRGRVGAAVAAERAGGRRRDQGRVPAERDVAGVRGDRAGDAGGAGARVRGSGCRAPVAPPRGGRGADRPDRAGRAARRRREGPRRRRAGGGRAVRLLGRRADRRRSSTSRRRSPTICRSRWRSCARRRC